MCTLICPQNGVVIDTHTHIQGEFIRQIREQGIAAALEWLLPRKNDGELTYPQPIQFQWSCDDSSQYVFELSEDAAFAAPYTIHTDSTDCTVTNLKIGQTYYWRVNGGAYNTFSTLDNQYRFLQVDGALNVRDLGGIHIKQGLLYRGSEIDREYKISNAGKRVLKEDLKIKSEINLRKEMEHRNAESCIGEGVRYQYLPYRPYGEMFEQEHRDGIVTIMEFLADENNYPVYFHCLGGADRTGMIAFLLRGLLGEADEDILIDYELTSLSSYAHGRAEGVSSLGFRSRETEYFQNFRSLFDAYNGNSIAEKTESFLMNCNVKLSTIEKIRSILKNDL